MLGISIDFKFVKTFQHEVVCDFDNGLTVEILTQVFLKTYGTQNCYFMVHG